MNPHQEAWSTEDPDYEKIADWLVKIGCPDAAEYVLAKADEMAEQVQGSAAA